jgi:transposase
MHKLEVQDADLMKMAIQDEILRSEESRYDHKLHGILLVCAGFSCYEVADLLGHSPRTIQYWIKRFEKSGFAGLQELPRSGRPSSIDDETFETLGKHLRLDPRNLGYNQNLWDGKLLGYHLEQTFGIKLGVRQCQRLFTQLGFRRRKPRPVIAHADPAAQQAYKKTTSSGSQKEY